MISPRSSSTARSQSWVIIIADRQSPIDDQDVRIAQTTTEKARRTNMPLE